MKLLRHPIRSIREPFGTAGLIVAIVALVAALAGGAYAANGGLTGKQKKEVEKIAKKYAGKPGAPGATGPQGAAGAAGAEGDNGAAGTNGTNGEPGQKGDKGDPGSSGKNVALTAIPTAGLEGHCEDVGGTRVEVEGTASSRQYVCNGEEGQHGQTGFAAELPPGATETGSWSTGRFTPVVPQTVVQISFPFTLPEGEAPTEKLVKPGAPITDECPGSVAHPEAGEGFVCLYAYGKEENSAHEQLLFFTTPIVPETGKNLAEGGRTGFSLLATREFEEGEEGAGPMGGTWAVTAMKAN